MTIREDADLHRAQRAFRCVLDAFAHPGTVHQLVPAPENPASPVALDASLELVVRLFVDQAVTFCVADSESDAVAVYLTSETHARRAPLRDADFVVVPARADAQTASEAVAEACRGTLVSPEKGATLLMGCALGRRARERRGDRAGRARGGAAGPGGGAREPLRRRSRGLAARPRRARRRVPLRHRDRAGRPGGSHSGRSAQLERATPRRPRNRVRRRPRV